MEQKNNFKRAITAVILAAAGFLVSGGSVLAAQACTPNFINGCSICNPSGSAWIDDNTKCAAYEQCFEGDCVAVIKSTPIVMIDANGYDDVLEVEPGGSATITWSSVKTTSCVAKDDWSGEKTTSGKLTVNNITKTQTFTIRCAGIGGSAYDSVTLKVDSGSDNMNIGNLFDKPLAQMTKAEIISKIEKIKQLILSLQEQLLLAQVAEAPRNSNLLINVTVGNITDNKPYAKTAAVSPGDKLTFMVSVANAGTSKIDGITIINTLPSEISNVTDQKINGEPSSLDITTGVADGTIQADEIVRFTFSATVKGPAYFTQSSTTLTSLAVVKSGSMSNKSLATIIVQK